LTTATQASVSAAIVDQLLSIQEIPEDVLKLGRLHFLDAVGIALAASQFGPARELPGSVHWAEGPCTVLSSKRSTGAADTAAALVNGTLMHSLEYDDTHTGSVMHGSSVLAAVVLAGAQELGDSRGLVRAFVLGWEVLIRFGLAVPSGFQKVGFQTSPVAGPIAGALALGMMRGFTREQLIDVIGVAVSFSSGNFTFLQNGATSKAAQAGIAAQGAVSAANLVQGGITGSPNALEGDRGLFGLYARAGYGGEKLLQLSTDIGERWHLRDAAFKGLPCCHFLHPFVEAAQNLGLTADARGDRGGVQRVLCAVPVGQENIIAVPWEQKQAPAHADEGRWSLPYVIALQAVHARVGLEHFVGEPDDSVVAFAQKVEWEPWTDTNYPDQFPAKLEVQWADGTRETCVIDDVDGNASRPWSSRQVIEKFIANCTTAGVSEERAESICEAILEAEPVNLKALRV
jgi:2-methylcitrate dehydratase PrpD